MGEMMLWTPEEMQERAKPKRERLREEKERAIAEYAAYFQHAAPGYGGQVMLDDDEDKRKVRLLVREAATQQGLTLRFRPIKDANRLEFTVIDPVIQKKGARRGRPRKTSEA